MVNDGITLEGDLLIENDRIARLDTEIPADGAEVIEGDGKYLLPGMIDDQVHFREPGLTHKAEIATESKAALAGGITSFMEMPNTIPQTVTLDALEMKFEHTQGKSWGNFAFYLGATNDNIEEIRALGLNQTCGIKVFMGASTGNMLVDNEETLEKIFRDAPTLIATHCENSKTIKANEERYRAEYGDNIPMSLHHVIRSEQACYESSSMAVALAKEHGTRLHVLHLTTAKELELFEAGPSEGKRITVEACVHHLYFDDSDYESKGSFIKCNPAIKTAADKAALRKALAEDRIDLIGTDHAPHTLAEKQETSYFKTPAGLPLVQHALQMALELYHDKVLTIEQVVQKTAHAPASMYGVVDRGHLREGYYADLVLVDLNQQQRIERDQVLYKCGWSPMEGEVLRSKVLKTFVNGKLSYDNGEFSEEPVGQRLGFNR